jgi:hypothetical protein
MVPSTMQKFLKSSALFMLFSLFISSSSFAQRPSTEMATFLPVIIVNWKADLDKNKVILNWTTTMEKYARHYVVERSSNGIDYKQIGLILVAGNSDNRKDYNFVDKLSNTSNQLYYRLKTTDLDGKNRISEVRMVVLGKSTNQPVITTYPNPTINELTITVPSNWQGKKLSLQIFNLNGLAVKEVIKDNASEKESMMTSELERGYYIVKATSGTESITKRILKAK